MQIIRIPCGGACGPARCPKCGSKLEDMDSGLIFGPVCKNRDCELFEKHEPLNGWDF